MSTNDRGAPRDRGRVWSVGASRVLPGPRELTFGILADTNRYNRLTGVSPTDYTYELFDPDNPESRTRVGHARFAGVVPIRFAEEGEYWAGARLRGERHFRDCFVARIFARGIYDVEVSPHPGPDGADYSRADLRVGLAIVGWLGYVIAPFTLLRMWITMRLLLRSVARAVRRAEPSAGEACPPAAVARHAGYRRRRDQPIVGDRFGKTSRAAVQVRAARFAEAPVSPALQRRVLDLVTHQPDDNLRQLRPFEIADAWDADRREVLRTFLYAARAGLFDLEWQINCPTCRVGSDVATRLADLERRVHCDECDISYDVGFAENVEATFTVNPAIRAVEPIVYCASSPYFRPHLHGYLPLAAGARDAYGPLPDGALLVRARGTGRQLRVPAAERGDGPLGIRVTDEAVVLDPEVIRDADLPADVEPGRVLVVANDVDREVRFMVERAGWDSGIARGSLLVTMPEFHDLFAADAPAAGEPLAVGTFAVVFTDIVGSMELYRRLGDARAYALIQEHWRACERIVAEHRGAMVKTTGDGVMCCFASIPDAVSASLEMIDDTERLSRRDEVEIAIRIGAHEGPCYAVRSHDRFDLFGSTVNLASRLMNAAEGREVALAADALSHPALHARLEAEDITVRRREHRLRGLRNAVEVLFATRTGADVLSTGEHAPLAPTELSETRAG